MDKTRIEWCTHSLNPVKGLCPVGCRFCYARRMYKRFKWDPEIVYKPSVFASLNKMPDGSRVFVGSTIDLFHDKTIQYLDFILGQIRQYLNLTFIFLTKCPQNLPREWPDNCWIGVSCTNHFQFHQASFYLKGMKAKVRFYSFEPLLEHINLSEPNPYFMGDWIICGLQTPFSLKTAPRIEWVKEIVQVADKAGVPVFLKNNLKDLLVEGAYQEPAFFQTAEDWEEGCSLRQELPKVKE